MYFFTYLFFLHTLLPFLPMQYFSSELFVEVLEKWSTRMDIGESRQTEFASWADLMISQRKEIAAFDIGRERHLTVRYRFLGLVSEAVLCR